MKYLWLLAMMLTPASLMAQMSIKMAYSPDTSVAVRIATVQEKGGINRETALEFWSRKSGRMLARNFISRDHSHGYGIMKTFWTLDSRYYIFSMMASGGSQPGWFPTWFFSRADRRVFSLDTLAGRRIINPEFIMENVDTIGVTFGGSLAAPGTDETAGILLSLDALVQKARVDTASGLPGQPHGTK
jgi:hypothetical protein